MRARYSSALNSAGVLENAHFDEPAVAVGVRVDRLGRVDDGAVGLDDLTVEGRVELTNRLGRLDLSHDRPRGERRADLRQVDVDDIAQRISRVLRDAHGGDIALEAHPLVLGGVLQVGGDCAHESGLSIGEAG